MSGICAALVPSLLDWYDAGHRDLPWRENITPYRVWVSEVMLQQTRAEVVKGYFTRWLAALPDIAALARAEEAVYMKLWEGLGYYSRARSLHRAAVEVCTHFGGELPANYNALLSLPGIGEYTAGAIASIAFNLPVPAVDGNVLRVASRLENDMTPVTDAKRKQNVRERIAALMPSSRPGDFNQSLMELGAVVCLPNAAPKCGVCPLLALCQGYQNGTAAALPRRAAKKPRRVEARTVLLPLCDGFVGLSKRPDKGLLAGLWELPSLDGHISSDALPDALPGWRILSITPLSSAKHIFTHVEWHMQGYALELAEKPAGLTFVAPTALRREYALPSAFRAFLSALEGE